MVVRMGALAVLEAYFVFVTRHGRATQILGTESESHDFRLRTLIGLRHDLDSGMEGCKNVFVPAAHSSAPTTMWLVW